MFYNIFIAEYVLCYVGERLLLDFFIRSIVEQNDMTYGMVTIYHLFCCYEKMELL